MVMTRKTVGEEGFIGYQLLCSLKRRQVLVLSLRRVEGKAEQKGI
ncbi:hypothetical protein SAMN04515668_4074 [Hymenobacter arizonensis]|uniref:Uncharacterized protein n=1 Tax=Hymenobacter arizonensis TaxID=1227077 RepID=A0A1I6AZ23_HYMAR|nr:hypothetical protein SAMN04515668_4074 [Hymenobacter arizonensis]